MAVAMASGAVLSAQVQQSLCELYQKYNTVFKPALAIVESTVQKFPAPVLNEIRAVNDHVARCFVVGKTEADYLSEIRKANGHLIRVTLDCYKIILMCYYDQVEDFKRAYCDVNLSLVGDGQFLPELTRLNGIAVDKAIKARQNESDAFPEKEQAYATYQDAILAYENVLNYIKGHAKGLANAEQHAKRRTREENLRNWKFAVISAILGTLFGWLISDVLYFF
ncbi:MAG: hypothetical protein K2I62_06345 [Alistipes sp.]|nr:hypothetical protein [Alistipes sp.]